MFCNTYRLSCVIFSSQQDVLNLTEKACSPECAEEAYLHLSTLQSRSDNDLPGSGFGQDSCNLVLDGQCLSAYESCKCCTSVRYPNCPTPVWLWLVRLWTFMKPDLKVLGGLKTSQGRPGFGERACLQRGVTCSPGECPTAVFPPSSPAPAPSTRAAGGGPRVGS